MLQYYNTVNNKNTVNEKVQDKNKNKANDVHSKKEKPGKEFLFLTVFAFSCHSERRSGGPEPRNLPLPADLSTAARGDKRAFGATALDKKRGKEKAANAFLLA